jgi:queuine tRNA-ribosyltransferase
VQGSTYEDLRRESAAALQEMNFEGYAIGGLAVGEGQEMMFATLEITTPHLPADKPRYLMGVGTPDDLLGSVARGVDMFDCVMPTRAGRTARGFTSKGVFNLRNARFIDDAKPLDENCACLCCTRHNRAYLHHLFRAEEILGPMLLTIHNLTYYQSLMQGARAAIINGDYAGYCVTTRAGWAAGDG